MFYRLLQMTEESTSRCDTAPFIILHVIYQEAQLRHPGVFQALKLGLICMYTQVFLSFYEVLRFSKRGWAPEPSLRNPSPEFLRSPHQLWGNIATYESFIMLFMLRSPVRSTVPPVFLTNSYFYLANCELPID